MKKLICTATAAAMLFGMTACGSKAASSAPETPVASASESAVGLVNPYVEATEDEVLAETGLSLVAPEGAEDVNYFIINTGSEKTAEMNFVYNGIGYCLRAVDATQTEAYDIGGLYYEWDYQESEPVGYCEGVLCLCDEAGCLYWQDVVPGINYTLGASEPVTIQDMASVAELCFQQVSADEFEPVWQSKDYTGVYTDDNENELVLTPEEGIYLFTATIDGNMYDGYGNNVDGAVEIELTNVQGDEAFAVFYPSENTRDSGFTLMITQSEIETLEEGTEYVNFFLDAQATIDMMDARSMRPTDYTGAFTNDENCAAAFEHQDDGTYKVKIDLDGLVFSGRGGPMDGAVEFELKNDAGNVAYGVFYPTQNTRDDGFELVISQSEIENLNEGSCYKKFFMDMAADISVD